MSQVVQKAAGKSKEEADEFMFYLLGILVEAHKEKEE
jgi:hypothetical protein